MSTDGTRIAALRAELERRNPGALDMFWKDVEMTGAPLVEPGSDGNVLVTFLWRGDADRVAVVGGVGEWNDLTKHEATRIPGTDTWYRSAEFRSDARALYWLSVNDPNDGLHGNTAWASSQRHWRLDPYNPQVFHFPYDEEVPYGTGWAGSLLELADAPVATEATGELQGELHLCRVRSALLGNERRVWIYTPPDFDLVEHDCPVVVFLDGHAYAQVMAAPTIIGNLIKAGRIPPLVGGVRRQSRNHQRCGIVLSRSVLLIRRRRIAPVRTS